MTENGRFQQPFHSEEQKSLQYTCDSSLGFKKKRSCQVKEPELEARSIPELRSFFSLQGQHDRVVVRAQKVKKIEGFHFRSSCMELGSLYTVLHAQ